MENKKEARVDLLKRTCMCTFGLVMFSVGIYLTIQANLGAAPWDVFSIGLAGKLNTLYGNAFTLINVVIFCIDLFVLKEKIGIGTIIDALIIGKIVDLLNWLNLVPLMQGSIIIRVLVLLAGFTIDGFSQYFYMKAGLCAGPKDTLQIGLSRKCKKLSVGVVNIFILGTVLLIGWILGGPVGIGSVIAPFGIGFMQDFAFKTMNFDPKTVKHESLIESITKIR